MPTVLKLKEGVTNPDGTPAKDGSKDNRPQEVIAKLKPSEIIASWPNLTVGQTLIGLINSRKPETIDDLSKMQRLLVKIRNKMLTVKGEWTIEKQELLDLEEVFQKSDPKTLNVNLHGQVYNKIKDLLIQAT